MSKYKWKRDNIYNSDLKEYTKQVLMNELASIKDDTSIVCYDATDYHSFKESYIQEYNTVKRLYPELVDYIDGLNTTALKSIKNIKLPFDTVNNESQLLNAMENLVIDLEDRDLISEYADIVNSNKGLINIEASDPINEIKRKYVGRCVSENNSKDTYISLYTNNDLTDFTNLAHEFGHAFEQRLFLDNRNPIAKNFLTEISSLYFELLMMNQLNKEFDVTSVSDYLNSNKLLYITRNILVNQMSLFILFQNRFDINSLLEFYRENLGSGYVISAQDGFYLSSYIDTINYIASYMIALKLCDKTLEDKYEGFGAYKELMQNPTTSLIDLLDKYGLNFIDNNDTYELVKLKSELAYKKLLKR